MKRFIIPVVAGLVLFVCLAVAIHEHDVTKHNNQVAQDHVVAKQAAEVIKLHDFVNQKNQAILEEKFNEANGQRQALCSIIKTTKAVYDPALCE